MAPGYVMGSGEIALLTEGLPLVVPSGIRWITRDGNLVGGGTPECLTEPGPVDAIRYREAIIE